MAEYIEKEKAARILREEAAAHYPTAFHVGLYAAARAIDSIPAADVRPVVHGRWLSTSDVNKKRCSRCDVIHLIAQYPHGEINFCPNCGAVMEES